MEPPADMPNNEEEGARIENKARKQERAQRKAERDERRRAKADRRARRAEAQAAIQEEEEEEEQQQQQQQQQPGPLGPAAALAHFATASPSSRLSSETEEGRAQLAEWHRARSQQPPQRHSGPLHRDGRPLPRRRSQHELDSEWRQLSTKFEDLEKKHSSPLAEEKLRTASSALSDEAFGEWKSTLKDLLDVAATQPISEGGEEESPRAGGAGGAGGAGAAAAGAAGAAGTAGAAGAAGGDIGAVIASAHGQGSDQRQGQARRSQHRYPGRAVPQPAGRAQPAQQRGYGSPRQDDQAQKQQVRFQVLPPQEGRVQPQQPRTHMSRQQGQVRRG